MNFNTKRQWDAFATTNWNHGITLTFDLPNLIRPSVGASEYSLSVLSKLRYSSTACTKQSCHSFTIWAGRRSCIRCCLTDSCEETVFAVWLTDWVKVLLQNWHKIGHFGDVLHNQYLGLVPKKKSNTKKQTCIHNKI